MTNTPRFHAPQPQQAWRVALEKALHALGDQTPDQLAWLGAQPGAARLALAVLGQTLHVDLATGQIFTAAGQEVRPTWRVLILHYLAVRDRPQCAPPSVTFADLASGRTYASVYQQRVVARLCATVGRERAALAAAAAALDATLVDGGDLAFELAVFSRLRIRVVWHAGDDEFPPQAAVLLPANIEEFFCTEDVTVLCECCVSRLQGKPF